MLTTQVDTETVRTALRHKATDFIRKDASIPKIAERLKRYLQAERKHEADAPPPDVTLAESIIKGCRKFHPREQGPYILFYEPPPDLQALGEASDKGLMAFFRQVTQAIDSAKVRYPGLEPGYSIEHDTKEVTRLAKRDTGSLKLVMVSGRRTEGRWNGVTTCWSTPPAPWSATWR